MDETYSGSWWAVVLRGLIALVVGIMLIINTGDAVTVLTQIFGLFVIVDGILIGLMAILGRKEIERSWVVFAKGLIGFAIGLALLFAPALSIGILILLIAIWALLSGVIDLILAWKIRHEFEGSWLLVAGGIVALLFGFVLLRNPQEVAEFILVLVGIMLVLTGIVGTLFGIHLKGIKAPGAGE